MNKPLVLIGLMLASLFLVVNTSNVDASEWSGILNCVFNSPKNQTYNTGHLTLNVSLYYAFAYFESQTYSIDDQPPCPFTVKLLEPELSSMAIVEGQLDGLVTLPALPDGAHKITIYMKTRSGFPTSPSNQESTIYFSIDTKSPQISNVSLQNQTFNQPQLPLNFALDEQPAWIGYSLDNAANVTITGNTTITAPNGAHTVTVYANDTTGNMAKSELISYSVQTISLIETAIIIGSVVVVVISVFLAVHFYRRHLHNST